MSGRTTINDLNLEITEIKGEIRIIKESVHSFIDEFKRIMYNDTGLLKQVNTNTDFRKVALAKGDMFKFAIGSGWIFVLLLGILNILHMFSII